ncbi:MAG: hypothetical protein WB975_12880 [Nitrososphaeraceae archaeon]
MCQDSRQPIILKILLIKLPNTFTAKILSGNAPNTSGDDTILYLRKAPARAPNANRRNSIPLIFVFHLPF